MLVHENSYDGDDKKLAEKGYLDTIVALERAKKESRSFFLVSSSFVFDRSLDREYEEGSVPNNRTPSALFLIETEKKVLEYSKGYVYRKQDLITDIDPLIDKIISFRGEPSLGIESLRPLSQSVYSDLLAFAISQGFGSHRVIHLAVPTYMPISEMWFSLRGSPFSIRESEQDVLFKGHIGFIYSKILRRFGFYSKLLARNKLEVSNYLKERAKYD